MKRILLIAWATGFLAGCGSSKPAGGKDSEYIEEARRYELEFRPSEFDPDPKVILKHDAASPRDSIAAPDEGMQTPSELVPGFRVQIFSSNSIDDANAAKSTAEAQFAQEPFYVVYDPPTYKLRGGDFLTRFEADRFAKQLRETGYKDAWVVPERVNSR